MKFVFLQWNLFFYNEIWIFYNEIWIAFQWNLFAMKFVFLQWNLNVPRSSGTFIVATIRVLRLLILVNVQLHDMEKRLCEVNNVIQGKWVALLGRCPSNFFLVMNYYFFFTFFCDFFNVFFGVTIFLYNQ